MTWTKLSDDFDVQCANLSDAAYRTHTQGLIWCMRRETDGAINKGDVRRFADTSDPEAAVSELVDKGFWEEFDNGYLILHHMEHQPESTVIAARRKSDTERQRKKRRKAAGLNPDQEMSRRDSERDTPRDDTRDPGRGGPVRSGETQNPARTRRKAGDGSSDEGSVSSNGHKAGAGARVRSSVVVDDPVCEYCGRHGPTIVDEHGYRLCAGACDQEGLG